MAEEAHSSDDKGPSKDCSKTMIDRKANISFVHSGPRAQEHQGVHTYTPRFSPMHLFFPISSFFYVIHVPRIFLYTYVPLSPFTNYSADLCQTNLHFFSRNSKSPSSEKSVLRVFDASHAIPRKTTNLCPELVHNGRIKGRAARTKARETESKVRSQVASIPPCAST